MTADAIAYVAMIVGFATALTAHVAIAFALAFRTPRWRAPLAFVVPPLAPFFALRDGRRVAASFWLCGVVVYVAARLSAS